MCVILICRDSRPDEDSVNKAWEYNNEGGGVAWRKNGLVHWHKGITIEEMQEYCKTLPLPFVAHFRVSSTGYETPELCHPFPVTKNVELHLKGKTKGDILFQNGTWKEWQEYSLGLSFGGINKIPGGAWNDTRAIAWNVAIRGEGMLDMLHMGKIVLFGPDRYRIFGPFGGENWTFDAGIFYSNKHFMHKRRDRGGVVTSIHTRDDDDEKKTTTVVGPTGGSARSASFRGVPVSLPGTQDDERRVQTYPKAVSGSTPGETPTPTNGAGGKIWQKDDLGNIVSMNKKFTDEEREKHRARVRNGIVCLGSI